MTGCQQHPAAVQVWLSEPTCPQSCPLPCRLHCPEPVVGTCAVAEDTPRFRLVEPAAAPPAESTSQTFCPAAKPDWIWAVAVSPVVDETTNTASPRWNESTDLHPR